MLNWVNRFNIFSFLDNQGYPQFFSDTECLVGAGVQHATHQSASLDELKQFNSLHDDWKFGHLSYELKNEIEGLQSERASELDFQNLFFFVPQVILRLSNTKLSIGILEQDPNRIFDEINSCAEQFQFKSVNASIQSRFSRDEYIASVEMLKQHILRGDCYEINFCQEFFIEQLSLDPVAVYCSLMKASPNPFSALYRNDDQWLLCASPERYIKRAGNRIYSQPIKGTSPRNIDPQKDEQNRNELLANAKERSENVMVVDLVRNDLSKICEEGSVHVDELFGIYSFPQVHQMISTVVGVVDPAIDFVDIVKATFPMGSMTGAPKVRVMELIEQYERSKRGIFSGALGYVEPGEDFDFNVIIRSLMYNAGTGYLSFQTGSAITFQSNSASEYEECLLKAEAIKKVLTG
ncbi:MAG: anthranilate synthase component I family protein [Chitinophagaceae bacterium]|nr:anthranilate synthase component I family protein [Chitinophagaceae bacterium]